MNASTSAVCYKLKTLSNGENPVYKLLPGFGLKQIRKNGEMLMCSKKTCFSGV